MRIALLAPIATPVPPPAYGGVETVVATLADGLVDAGHHVTLFATGNSGTRACLEAIHGEPPSHPKRRTTAEVEHALNCFLRANQFDLVHSHIGALGAALSANLRVPVLHTVSDPLDRTREVWRAVARFVPRLLLASISRRQQELAPELPWISNCPNGLDLRRYPVRQKRGDYLAFLGRMSPDKGCHHAIRVARAVGLPLRIGAKLEEEHEREYFAACVAPELGADVQFLGELTHGRKVELLAGARAALFPTSIEEAFGLVLVESMACGTPVVAFRCGAVPEIVADGFTGYTVDNAAEMASAIRRIDRIEREACRRHVEANFSATRLVRAYEHAYELAVAAYPRWTREPPTIAFAPSSKRTQALPLPS
jgi:glycosyltransferase involved in cell wall biosynthesis